MPKKQQGFGLWDLFDFSIYLIPLAILYWFQNRSFVIIGVVILISTAGFLVLKVARKKSQLRHLNLAGVDVMSGEDFEHYVAELLRFQGYKTKVIGGRNDLGIDLIAAKDGMKYAIQVKRWSKAVGRRAISDAVAGKGHYGCNRAIVITNNYFSEPAKKLAISNNCRLIDRDVLAIEIQKMNQATRKKHKRRNAVP